LINLAETTQDGTSYVLLTFKAKFVPNFYNIFLEFYNKNKGKKYVFIDGTMKFKISSFT